MCIRQHGGYKNERQMLSLMEHSQKSINSTVNSSRTEVCACVMGTQEEACLFLLLGNEKTPECMILVEISEAYGSFLKILLVFVCVCEIFTRHTRLFLLGNKITHMNLPWT